MSGLAEQESRVPPLLREKVLADPGAVAGTASAWMILGGPALFLAGHAAFKLVVWRALSWPRLAGIAALGLLGLAAGAIPALALGACAAAAIPALALGACAAAVVIAVAVSDRLPWLPRPAEPAPRSSPGDPARPRARS